MNFLKKYFSRKAAQTQVHLSPGQTEALAQFATKLEKLKKKKNISFESLLWDLYPQFVKLSVQKEGTQDAEYAKLGYKQGIISQQALNGFNTLLASAESYPISHADYDPRFVTHPDLSPYEKDLNASHRLFKLEGKLLDAIFRIAQELKEPVAACLGSPWRIINVLCWETFPDAVDQGPNAWHKDGLPFAINKVMIYLNGAGSEKGTTTLKFDDGTTKQVVGPEGTWLLFKISEILHKGEKPQKGSRIVLEIRVSPSFAFDLRPFAAGFNAHYPKVPWEQLF